MSFSHQSVKHLLKTEVSIPLFFLYYYFSDILNMNFRL